MDDHKDADKSGAKEHKPVHEARGNRGSGLVADMRVKFKGARASVVEQLAKAQKPLVVATAAVCSFETLYRNESKKLDRPIGEDEKMRVPTGAGDEPWISFTPRDRLGLALSGGGIRSATFNLGLLQALDQLGVLTHVDYLATVSGGGYIGGFWTAWLVRRKRALEKAKAKGTEPSPRDVESKGLPVSGDKVSGESPEVRHLREFSRFLLPSIRVLGTEFWGIWMTVVGGMLPSLLSALAVLVLMWCGWVGLLACLTADVEKKERKWLMVLFVALYFAISEILSRRTQGNRVPAKQKKSDLTGYRAGVLVACALTAGSVYWVRDLMHASSGTRLADAAVKNFKIHGRGLAALTEPTVGFWPLSVVAAVTFVLMVLRFLFKKLFKGPDGFSFFGGCERALTQMLRLTAVLAVCAGLWWLAVQTEDSAANPHLFAGTVSGTALSTGLFLWLRKWLAEPPKETHGGDLMQLVVNKLKRATPKVLAGLSWLLIFVMVGVGVEWCIRSRVAYGWPSLWLAPVVCLLQGVLMIVCFDPTRMSLHELYRTRISRCYLGASNREGILEQDTDAQRVEKNRSTNELTSDDLTLHELGEIDRPIHLVCTAANDLSGDPVGTLYRGAKSAVLSCHGISLGNETAALDKLKFSSALTASAAAFNSQMGRISMGLGPAVTFLMSAFNLRLGLWVPHPSNNRRWKFPLPGRFFFYELLGLSTTEGRHLFLSDGGHFENFGLYELLRRHCRYIIVSDCGADLEVAFDDLANVLRRVREDFSVEVELDVASLRPGPNGLAAQHAVVGTIHYDGLAGMDKGTILFIKPAITGDEPPDVLQYRTRNNTFPQESTANQFYDEPQWESYRRLGEHTGRTVLYFLDKPESIAACTVDHIFRESRSFWHPKPENLDANFIELSGRCAELEESLTSEGPMLLRGEFFSEAVELSKIAPATDQSPEPSKPAPPLDEELKILGFLIRIMQIMEDVWIAGDFERYWSHPLNEGWMNYFHRWAETPSFRRWWPVLAPIYSPGFRAFVKERFAVGSVDPVLERGNTSSMAAQLRLFPSFADNDYLESHAWRSFLQHGGATDPDKQVLGYALQLLNRDGKTDNSHLWVGFMLIRESPDGSPGMVEWRARDFFVPPMWHGGKMVSNFLDAVIQHYKLRDERPIATLKVKIDAAARDALASSPRRKPQGLAPAARYEQVRTIEFYKSRGFQYREPETDDGIISLYLDLRSK